MRHSGFSLAIAAVAALSCGGNGNHQSDPNEAASSPKWETCPDYIGSSAQCALVDAPLSYDNPSEGAISLFLWRMQNAPQSRAQVWLLAGGPGIASNTLTPIAKALLEAHPDWAVYSMDHRGVGNSTLLECAAVPPGSDITDENVRPCLDELNQTWGGKLQFFSTTSAARDLSLVVERTRTDAPVYVYGVSYGTYLLQRYLVLFPAQIQGIVLDSIVTQGQLFLDEYDVDFNQAGKQVMDRCKVDATCSSHLSTIDADPWGATGLVFAKIDRGEICAPLKDIYTRPFLRNVLAALSDAWPKRALMPPVIYRLNRCNEGDQAALKSLASQAEEGTGPKGIGSNSFVDVSKLNSQVLAENIILSELWHGSTFAQEEAIVNDLFVSQDFTLPIAQVHDTGLWPVYHDPLVSHEPSTSQPMLMLNSNIDGETPLDQASRVRSFFGAANQRFIVIPFASHVTVVSSPTNKEIETNSLLDACGLQIMESFVENPADAPNTACLGDLYPLEFSGTSAPNKAASEENFGTPNMWGD